MPRDDLRKALAVAAELTRTEFSRGAADVLVKDLSYYPEKLVLDALTRCRRELRPGQLTLEAIVSRMDDGHPGPEEAWAMIPSSEDQTIVWTEEMRESWAQVLPMISSGERIPARMAFKEIYETKVRRARFEGRLPRWVVSLGHDQSGRRHAIVEAVAKRRIGIQEAQKLLPAFDVTTGQPMKQIPLLEAPHSTPAAKEGLQRLKAVIAENEERARRRKAEQMAEVTKHANDPEWWNAHGWQG